jgi:hypothetical protein
VSAATDARSTGTREGFDAGATVGAGVASIVSACMCGADARGLGVGCGGGRETPGSSPRRQRSRASRIAPTLPKR